MTNFLEKVNFYCSTRGSVKCETLEETLFSGFLGDGGIFVPQNIKPLDYDTWISWKHLSYPQTVGKLLELFSADHELSYEDIEGITRSAFRCFREPEIIPLKDLDGKTFVAELFQGPTLAFKDLAMSVIRELLEFYLSKRKKHITILVGTSGDTGSAAIECVRGSKWADIVVLYPKGRCSVLQEMQMITVLEDNVHVFAVDGTSDELDQPIKACFADRVFVEKHNLCSINSINWVRILVQVAHYFYLYLRLCPLGDETLEFLLPTGACGNLTSGVIAKRLGLPIKLVANVNNNCCLHKALAEGVLDEIPAFQTMAPAMDIQVPYNFERLLYFATDANHKQVKKLMTQLEEKKSLHIPSDILKKLKEMFSTDTVNDQEIASTMKRCYQENRYLIDPHTAVALAYHYKHTHINDKRVCLATASPEKFPESVKKACIDVELKALNHLYDLPVRFQYLETGQWEVQLRHNIRQITDLRKDRFLQKRSP